MGCFELSCGISDLPIPNRTPVRLLILRPKTLGLTAPTSRLLWEPICLSMKGAYNDYGRLEISEDDQESFLGDVFFRTAISMVHNTPPSHFWQLQEGLFEETFLTRSPERRMRDQNELLPLRWSLIREDVWQLLRSTQAPVENLWKAAIPLVTEGLVKNPDPQSEAYHMQLMERFNTLGDFGMDPVDAKFHLENIAWNMTINKGPFHSMDLAQNTVWSMWVWTDHEEWLSKEEEDGIRQALAEHSAVEDALSSSFLHWKPTYSSAGPQNADWELEVKLRLGMADIAKAELERRSLVP